MKEVTSQSGKTFRVVEKRSMSSASKYFESRIRQLFMQPACGGKRHQCVVLAMDQQRRHFDGGDLLPQVDVAQPAEADEQRCGIWQ